MPISRESESTDSPASIRSTTSCLRRTLQRPLGGRGPTCGSPAIGVAPVGLRPPSSPPIASLFFSPDPIGPPPWTHRIIANPCPRQLGPLYACLLYTSDAADDLLCVDLGGRC